MLILRLMAGFCVRNLCFTNTIGIFTFDFGVFVSDKQTDGQTYYKYLVFNVGPSANRSVDI